MNAYVRPHPDGFKSYLGKNQKTGLYIVRVGWTVYETNGNGSVLYIVKNEDTIPLDVEKFKTDRPKIYAALLSEVQFQRRNNSRLISSNQTSLLMTVKPTKNGVAL